MLGRKEISDLSQTGHPHETSKLILDGIKEEKMKSKSHITKDHTISIHFNKKTKMVNIDVEENGKLIPMSILQQTAIAQAHKTQA